MNVTNGKLLDMARSSSARVGHIQACLEHASGGHYSRRNAARAIRDEALRRAAGLEDVLEDFLNRIEHNNLMCASRHAGFAYRYWDDRCKA